MTVIHIPQPSVDRSLTVSERMRLTTALLEAELEIDEAAVLIPDDWIRILHAPVSESRALSGCYRLDLIAHANARFRAHQAGASDDEVPLRWWHRFTDWWWKW